MAAVDPKSRYGKKAGLPAQAEDTRREFILDAALQVFARRSFDGASTREIAQRAGVTQSLIAYHFSNKDRLWRDVVNRLFAELNAALDQDEGRLQSVDDRDHAKEIVRKFVRYCALRPQLFQIITGECKSEGERMDWLVDTHVRPIYEQTVAMSRFVGVTDNVPAISPKNFYYILVGAGATMFVLGAECRRLTGEVVDTQQAVDDHIDAVVALLFK